MYPSLTTPRLLLLPVLPPDQPFVFAGLSHPDVIRHYGVHYETLEETAAQMKWYAQLAASGTGLAWKITDRRSGEKMGVIAVYYFKPQHRKAEVGFWLLPPYWRQGYAKEALLAALHYWQTQKGLHRMEAFVEEENSASSRVLEKAGFRLEGILRNSEIKDGRFISLKVYAWLGAP